MSAEIPDILFRTKRGLCPNCGAPLPLNPDAPIVKCGFCDGKSVLERRLRRAEPHVDGTPLRLYFNSEPQQHGVSPWVLRGQIGDRQEEEANCPGCGDVLKYASDATIVHCKSCGTDSRVERRLRAPAPDLSRENAKPRHPSEINARAGEDHDEDPETEHLIWRILHETDLNTRFRLAQKLGDSWGYVNRTATRLLPALLRWMRDEDPRLQRAVSQIVCKLLCQGDPDLRNGAIQAAERVMFDLKCPRPLLFEVGMGNGTCLKLLLDAAEFGVRSGDFQYACQALLGVDYIFQRNFDQHEVMGQIILYRMLYLTGPTLAFAFLLAQRQVTGTGFYYKPETLLRFMDEAVLERPTLVPELDRSFYCGGAEHIGELRRRIHFYKSLQSDEARRAALRHWMILPDEPSDEMYAEMVGFIEPLLDQPAVAEAAAIPLQYAVGRGWRKMPAAIHDLVKRRGDSLPAEVRREYVQWVKDSPYIDQAKIPNWNSEPEPEMSPEMKKALEEWKAGLRAAVDHFDAIRSATSELYREVCGEGIDIWDGRSDGPKPPKKSRSSRSLVEADESEELEETDEAEDEEEEIDEEEAAEAEAAREEQERQEERDAFKRQIAELDQIIDGTCPHWAGMFNIPPGLTKEQQAMWEQSAAAMKGAIKQAQEDARKTKERMIADWKKREK